MKKSKKLVAFALAVTMAVSSGATSAFAMTDEEFREDMQKKIDESRQVSMNIPDWITVRPETTETVPQTPSVPSAPVDPTKPEPTEFQKSRAQNAAGVIATNETGHRVKAFYSAEGWNYNEARDAFNLQNKEREKAGKEPLMWSDDLYILACARAKEMFEQPSHIRPGDTKIISENQQYGLGFVGENAGSTNADRGNINQENDAQSIIESWVESEGHYANIIYTKFRSGAIACYTDGWGSAMWVSVFNLDTSPSTISRPVIQHKDGTTTELPSDEVLFAGPTTK